MEYVGEYLEFIKGLDTGTIYLVIFLAGFFENCIPPIPGDVVTVFSASMVGMGRLEFVPVFLIATAGNLAGFMTMYHVGLYFGRDFFMRKRFRFFPPEKIEKAEAWFEKYGYALILVNRFLSGLRSVISIFAGMARLKRRKIIPLALLSACLWDGVLIYGGYMLGDNWPRFLEIVEQYNWVVLLITVTVLTAVIVWKVTRRLTRNGAGHDG